MTQHRCQLALLLGASLAFGSANGTTVAMCTESGRVLIELFDEDAPQHVENFLDYTDTGFYGGTVFHRVIRGFVVQGGGFDRELRQKRPRRSVVNESRNGHDNERGTLAAARTNDPDSASSQFFINVTDNPALDATRREPGYSVFGEVIDGMDVVDEISRLRTDGQGPFSSDVPEPLITITSISRVDKEAFPEVPYTERHDMIRSEIDASLAADDQAAAFEWFRHYRNACGTMDADLLISESDAAVAIGNDDATLAALEEYLRIADDTHPSYASALDTYLRVVPDSTGNNSSQPIMPSSTELTSHCVPSQIPEIPDGSTATMDEMVQAQTLVRAYMAASNEHLECLSAVIEGEELLQDERALLTSTYNQLVDVMEAVAADFNDQVRIIRGRQ